MITLSSPELAFNARWLSETEVAASFVAPYHFARVARRGHTLIVGPRGSGKTTLLKMLQPAALSVWKSQQAQTVRPLVDYCGAFVPADISWSQQVAAAAKEAGEDPGNISRAAFTISALRALVETAEWRLTHPLPDEPFQRHLSVQLPREKEIALVREISDSWGLTLSTYSMLGLRHGLRKVLFSLRAQIGDISDGGIEGAAVRPNLLSIDLLDAAGLFAEMFNDAVGERDRRWALLFDELEIAPAEVQKYLFRALRSSDPRLLFKLALSPFNDNIDLTKISVGPSVGQDYEQVALWFASRDSATRVHQQLPFCNALWETTLERLQLPIRSAELALGQSLAVEGDLDTSGDPLIPAGDQNGRTYGHLGRRGTAFRSLEVSDQSFRDYLQHHKITLREMGSLREPEKAQFIRKIAPIVAVREFYRGSRGKASLPEQVGRSRKSVELYTGADSFFTVSEGHPRWLKMVFARLLESSDKGNKIKVSRSAQGVALLSAAHRFNALLAALPIDAPTSTTKFKSVHQLVKCVAEYFHDEVVTRDFQPEPVLSFVVDANVPKELLSALQVAVNIGAFVYMPDGEGEIVLRSLRGKRFRVSHWLAPVYGLPLVAGRSSALSSILGGKRSDTLSLELRLGD